MDFPVAMYGCECWTSRKLNAKELMLLNCGVEKTLESSLDCKEIQLVNPKGNQSWIFIGRTDAEAEAPIFSHLMRRTDSSEMFWCWVRLKSGGEVGGGDEMIGWRHRLNGHKFEQAAGVGDGQGSLMCWSPWGRKVSVMIERLKWLTGWSRKWQGWTLTS